MSDSLDDLWDEGAYEELVEAAREEGHDLLEGMALFHLWRFDEAERALARFEPDDDDDEADREWYMGLLAEFRERDPGRHFRRAVRLCPERYPEPVRLSDAEIDAVVEEALAALPAEIAEAASDAVISVAPLPAAHPDVDPLVLGLYTGSDHLSRSVDEAVRMPARIEVFRKNIERVAADREEAIEELRITLEHELAHHLGFDEEDMERLGLD